VRLGSLSRSGKKRREGEKRLPGTSRGGFKACFTTFSQNSQKRCFCLPGIKPRLLTVPRTRKRRKEGFRPVLSGKRSRKRPVLRLFRAERREKTRRRGVKPRPRQD